MSLEKITEGLDTVEDLMKVATKAGVNEKKLGAAIQNFSLPIDKEFTFDGVTIVKTEIKGDAVAYITIGTECGHLISVGKIQAIANDCSIKEAENLLEKAESGALKGKFVLKGGKMINPLYSGNQAELVINKLKGKTFTAELIKDQVVLSYDKNGYSTKEKAVKELSTKDFYKLTLVD